MNRIPCIYYLNSSLEMADFCINYDHSLSHKIFYLNTCICIELLLKNLVVYKVYKENINKNIEDLLSETTDLNKNIIDGFAEGSTKIEKEKQVEIKYQLFLRLVKKELKNNGHNLHKLLNFDNDLKTEIGLQLVESVHNEFISNFKLTLNDGIIIMLPTLEGARYNVFSGEQNVIDISSIDNFKNLQKIVEKIKEYINKKVKY